MSERLTRHNFSTDAEWEEYERLWYPNETERRLNAIESRLSALEQLVSSGESDTEPSQIPETGNCQSTGNDCQIDSSLVERVGEAYLAAGVALVPDLPDDAVLSDREKLLMHVAGSRAAIAAVAEWVDDLDTDPGIMQHATIVANRFRSQITPKGG